MKKLNKLKKRLKKVESELDKIGFDTPLNYGMGTQRLGHAHKRRDGLAQEKFKLRQQIEELENENDTN